MGEINCPTNVKKKRTISVWNAVKKADKITTTVASINTYSMVACPRRAARGKAGFLMRMALISVIFIVGDDRPFRRNQPLFNGFHHRFCAAAYAQFMKGAVQMVFNRFDAAVKLFGKFFVA